MNMTTSGTEYVFFYMIDMKEGRMRMQMPSKITADGHTYSNVEHYLAAKMCMYARDYAEMAKVMNPNPLMITQNHTAANKIRDTNRDVWDRHIMDVLNSANYLKFTSNDWYKEALMSTGDKEIVYATPFDHDLGIGYREEDAIENRYAWGDNKLGKSLMSVRERIRNESSSIVENKTGQAS
jgi:ribA/ribD-fused uncharacterized protein